MEIDLIDGALTDKNKDRFILDILKNIEQNMPKAKRARTSNIRMVQDYILLRTSVGGRTSAFEQCKLMGVDSDAHTFFK